MKIFYFAALDFYRKPNPSFHLMTTMLSDLMKNGNEIYYLGIRERNVEKHVPDEFENNEFFHYRLIDLPSVEKKNTIRRYLRGILYALKALFKSRDFIKDSDVCFIQSTPTILYNVIVTKLFSEKKKVLINIQDMFPGSSIASGVMPRKWMQNIFYWLQKFAYRKADKIVAISSDMKRKLIEQDVPEDKIEVILNWFDDSAVREVPWAENRFVQKYNVSKEQFCVQYAGTMGYVFDYKIVLDVADILKEYKDIIIQMIGEGSQKEAFMNASKERGLDNIQFLPLEPQNMVSDVYSACDVCFIPLKRGVIGNSVPSKAGLLMQCKRAIVTSVDMDSDYAKEMNDNKIGIACPDIGPQKIAEAILSLYHNREECSEMGRRGYEYGHELYSRTRNMKLYQKLFEDCCK